MRRSVPYNGDSINEDERKHSFARRDSIFSKVGGHNFKKFIGGSMGTSTFCVKFMEFLPKKRKKNDDVFSLSFMPP